METLRQTHKHLEGEIPEPGLHVYIGTTGTGKTHLAIRHAIALADHLRQGVFVVDSGGAKNLKAIPEVTAGNDPFAVKAETRAVWSGAVRRFVPHNSEEFERAIQLIDRNGNVVVMIDEVSFWASNPEFLRLCRVWRHRDISLFLTTQKMGRDVEQTVQACDPTLYVFRCTASRTLEYFERWHGLTPQSLRALSVGEHYRLRD